MIRWINLITYPSGVSVTEGDDWYIRTHAQEARRMVDHGLIGYRTWKALVPDYPSRTKSVAELQECARLTELCFTDWDAFRAAMTAPLTFTPAPYGSPGFVAQQIFISEAPEYDLLHGPESVQGA